MARQTWKPGNMLYPVPAVMVTVQKPGEKLNIITIAWAGTVCSDPPMVSISVRKERYSYGILHETKEFAVNLVTDRLVRAMDFCGVRSGRDVDKFKEMKLTPVPVEGIKTPGIEESPLILSCKVKEEKVLGSHVMFLAEVVSVSVDEALLDPKGKFCLNQAGLVAYSHGEYFLLGKKLGKFGYSVRKKDKRNPKNKKTR
jgi:flavin reductase (DIM6/NTAB) family NADH-FMN oxidoreductase RutF